MDDMEDFIVRRARRSDARAFLALLTALAGFERLEPPNEAAKRRIVSDIFARHRLGLFVAEAGGELVGYALYFYSYSSFLGRATLYLEDIFVTQGRRGKGIGSALFRRCANEAISKKCGRMEWAVLTWNRKAINFYEMVGAKRLDDWHVYRLSSDQLVNAARTEGTGKHA
jgi:GNAT superfamily N-acetyltransferase